MNDKKHIFGLPIAFGILILLVWYMFFVLQPERDARQEELDNYCISKGYDEAYSRFISNYAGVDVVHCRKEVVTIDDNGIVDLDIISDTIVFSEASDKK